MRILPLACLLVTSIFLLASCSEDSSGQAPVTTAPAAGGYKPPPAPAEPQVQAASGVEAELEQSHSPLNKLEEARNSTVLVSSGFATGYGFFYGDGCNVVTAKNNIVASHDTLRELKVRRSKVRALLERGVTGPEERKAMEQEQLWLDNAVETTQSNGRAKEVSVELVNGRKIPAKVIGISKQYGLGYLLLKEQGCRAVQYFGGDPVTIAEKAYAIGTSADVPFTVIEGKITGYLNNGPQGAEVRYFQTDITPGEGAPLLDENGNVLAIYNGDIEEAEGVALPASELKKDIEAVKGQVEQSMLSAEINSWEPVSLSVPTEQERLLAQQASRQRLRACIDSLDADGELSLEPCEKSAGDDIPMAKFILGSQLASSEDEKAQQRAIDLYIEAARGSYPEALYTLANMRMEGTKPVMANPALALEYYQEACDKGFGPACYAYGAGLVKDLKYQQAIPALESGRQLGSPQSMYRLGALYEKGQGTTSSTDKAIQLYREAAMLGSGVAAMDIAWFYFKGQDLERDFIKAYAWLMVAEKDHEPKPDDWSRDFPSNPRFHIERLMSSDQVSQGQVMAASLKKEIQANRDENNEVDAFRARWLETRYPLLELEQLPEEQEPEGETGPVVSTGPETQG